ncbi:MAG: paraquat-inducible protein B [Alphaproteobacteria bacterium ADurb.Bin438]|nr:MAG: paraquat-inducible protein B [Alphaproteobacteria bacterium ADurb.Bin438]
MSRDEIVKKLIEHGLRAKLIQGNLLTGQLNIELEINPHSEAIFRGDNFSSQGVMEIPTLLSAFSEFSKEIHDIKIKSTVNELNKLLTTFNQYAPKILDEAHKISVNVNKKLEKTNGNGEDPVNNFNQTLKDVSDMAKSFKNLADYLERNPEALLRGKGR